MAFSFDIGIRIRYQYSIFPENTKLRLATVTDNLEFWRIIIDSFFRNVGLDRLLENHLRSLISRESRPVVRRDGPYGVFGGPGDDGGTLIRGANFDWGRHLADSLPRHN